MTVNEEGGIIAIEAEGEEEKELECKAWGYLASQTPCVPLQIEKGEVGGSNSRSIYCGIDG